MESKDFTKEHYSIQIQRNFRKQLTGNIKITNKEGDLYFKRNKK